MKYMDFDEENYYKEDLSFNWRKLSKMLLFEEDSYK